MLYICILKNKKQQRNMGLDIYLYRYNDLEKSIEKEEEYEKTSEKNWEKHGEYDSLTDEQKKSIREENKKMALEMGLSEDGSDSLNYKKMERASSLYPDHYFKMGYFRSSYNGSGMERILKNLGVPTMYEIFGVSDGEYYVKPDWEKSLDRAKSALELLRSKPSYRCFDVGYNEFMGRPSDHPVKNEKDAMAVFIKELEKNSEKPADSESYNYSNRDGEFFMDENLKVVALIPGVKKRFFVDEYLPCVNVIYESSNEWYIQALEIIIETIEFVLSQENKNQYYLRWSG